MAQYLDSVPYSGIIRIRDLMYTVEKPFRLDQGDVSFDVPDTVRQALKQGIADNRSHYVQTTGIPPLLDLLVRKVREKNQLPVKGPEEIFVTAGGSHGVFCTLQGLLEPGDEVLVPDPEWPPAAGGIECARGVPVPYKIYESLQWRPDVDEMRRLITKKTRAIYVNSPNNPTGGILTPADFEAIAALAREHDLWVISDEAYEDILFEGHRHLSIASLPDMYDRTISLFTFSKTYAMTGLRLGYVVAGNKTIRDRIRKVLFYSVSSVSSLIQYGGVGALEGSQQAVEDFRIELGARRDLFYEGIRDASRGVFSGEPPGGAFYAFLKIDPGWRSPLEDAPASQSWAMTEYLIKQARIGCVPGADFGENGEGYIRFCLARDRKELEGALQEMKKLFS
ncbi:MAG: pyridoxal phosphate-dependent aminotransferase [Vicinamibacterales bacterium]